LTNHSRLLFSSNSSVIVFLKAYYTYYRPGLTNWTFCL